MNKTVKRIIGNWLDPYRSLGNIAMLLFGLLILTDGDIGIKATADGEVKWLGIFSTMPDLFGWLLLWFCFDDIFTGGKITRLVLERVTQTLSPIVKSIIGEERFVALQKHFEKTTEDKDKEKETEDERQQKTF